MAATMPENYLCWGYGALATKVLYPSPVTKHQCPVASELLWDQSCHDWRLDYSVEQYSVHPKIVSNGKAEEHAAGLYSSRRDD